LLNYCTINGSEFGFLFLSNSFGYDLDTIAIFGNLKKINSFKLISLKKALVATPKKYPPEDSLRYFEYLTTYFFNENDVNPLIIFS
jgi:hypothetical protein